MPVETRPTSQYWYGRWRRDGHRFCKKLKVRVAGEPGSDEFAASRVAAEEELQKIVEGADQTKRPEDLVQRMHEIKFGARIGSIRLNQLADEWLAIPRRRDISKGRAQFGVTVINRFASFMHSHYPRVTEMAAVTAVMAEDFMAAEEKRKVSGRTYNATLSLLRGAFERLRVKAGMLTNPFSGNLVMKDEHSIPRKPFTVEELGRLFEASKMDADIHALIVTGACTALRRGDACCLKWSDVNLDANRIRVQTRKTGGNVVIPILPALRTVLEARGRTASPYVFPALAAAYLHEPSDINKRLNAVFVRAGLRDASDPDDPEASEQPPINIPNEDELRAEVLAKLKALTFDQVSPRVKDQLIEVFDLYSSGSVTADIAKTMKVSKGSVSNYLNMIEKFAGHPIVRREVLAALKKQAIMTPAEPSATESPARTDKRGVIRVNARGFHALRATFTTQALAAGVPVEVVKLITGHSITETVLKHYFNPDEATVLKTVEKAMPRLLTGGDAPSVRDRLLAAVNGMRKKRFEEDRKSLSQLIVELVP